MNRSWNIRFALLASLAPAMVAPASAQQQKPNILVIMGDDIGYWNISAYNRGMMGYRTPNIDRIANEGAIFTDYYGQQSCTAGRAAFITGQSPLRTGLLKVGLPAAKEGLSAKDPTIAELLKPQGYATGQFGKNHLGDRNEFLPTVHGFDEFFGNLYHLNAEDEPEHPDYPKNPAFKAQFGPRGVMKCVAVPTDTPGDDPRFGTWGKQKCEDTGPLTKKRMETIDEEFLGATDRLHRARKSRQEAVLRVVQPEPDAHLDPSQARNPRERPASASIPTAWWSMTDRSGRFSRSSTTSASPTTRSSSTPPITAPRHSRGPMAAPRHSRARRTPTGKAAIASRRWCAGLGWCRRGPRSTTSSRQRIGRRRWSPRPASPTSRTKLLSGYDAAGKNFKVHLDGYDQRDLLARKGPNKRREFFYWTDDGNLAGLRYDQWKAVFLEQKAHGFDVWAQPMIQLRLPSLFNLRSDPFERAQHEAGDYVKWFVEHAFVLVPAQAIVGQHLMSFQQFPPRQRPGSFSVEQAMEKLRNPPSSN